MKFVKASLIFVLVASVGYINFGTSKEIKHQIKKRADGGYALILTGSVRHLIPLSAEGFFPKVGINYQIDLKGSGKDWEFRNQPGFYYSYPDNIECKTPRCNWDMGYAWVDKNRKTINLNFYWVMSPDSLEAASVNGSYKID